MDQPASNHQPALAERIVRVLVTMPRVLWVLVFTLAATLIRWALDDWLGIYAPYSFYYVSIALSALLGRFSLSMLAIGVGGFCGHYFWVEPKWSMEILNQSQLVNLFVYTGIGLTIALTISAARTLQVLEALSDFDR